MRAQFGIGTDIIEVHRFRALPRASPFYSRTFTENELAYCHSFSDSAPHLAAIFAGKEAVLKALSSQFELPINKIEILHIDGKPYVKLDKVNDLEISVSLSHSTNHAVAVALVYSSSNDADREIFKRSVDRAAHEIKPE